MKFYGLCILCKASEANEERCTICIKDPRMMRDIPCGLCTLRHFCVEAVSRGNTALVEEGKEALQQMDESISMIALVHVSAPT